MNEAISGSQELWQQLIIISDVCLAQFLGRFDSVNPPVHHKAWIVLSRQQRAPLTRVLWAERFGGTETLCSSVLVERWTTEQIIIMIRQSIVLATVITISYSQSQYSHHSQVLATCFFSVFLDGVTAGKWISPYHTIYVMICIWLDKEPAARKALKLCDRWNVLF